MRDDPGSAGLAQEVVGFEQGHAAFFHVQQPLLGNGRKIGAVGYGRNRAGAVGQDLEFLDVFRACSPDVAHLTFPGS